MAYLINDSKSTRPGATTVGDMQGFLRLPVPGMGGKTFEQQFPDEAALVNAQIRAVQRRERTDSNASQMDFLLGIETELRIKADEFNQDGIHSQEEVEKLERLCNEGWPWICQPYSY